MKPLIFYSLLVLSIRIGYGQYEFERFDLNVKQLNNEPYVIEVLFPSDYSNRNMYPVIYVTDWYLNKSYYQAAYHQLNWARKSEQFIIVGIEHTGTIDDYAVKRWWDLTPYRLEQEVQGVNPDSTGFGKLLLEFIVGDLMPLIEKKYSIDKNHNGLAGFSLGGLFCSYVLIEKPKLFTHFLIGSPSLWYNSRQTLRILNDFNDDHFVNFQRLFLSVASDERLEMRESLAELSKLLNSKKQKTTEIKTQIIPVETHSGAKLLTIYYGLKFLYERN